MHGIGYFDRPPFDPSRESYSRPMQRFSHSAPRWGYGGPPNAGGPPSWPSGGTSGGDLRRDRRNPPHRQEDRATKRRKFFATRKKAEKSLQKEMKGLLEGQMESIKALIEDAKSDILNGRGSAQATTTNPFVLPEESKPWPSLADDRDTNENGGKTDETTNGFVKTRSQKKKKESNGVTSNE